MKIFHTYSSRETQKLAKKISRKLKSVKVICLSGDLGSGKTTFVQGLLKELGATGPYTSPTFVILKEYFIRKNKMPFERIYHGDAYRVSSRDFLALGWKEIIACPENLVIVEWAERIKKILPKNSLWIRFFWEEEKKRRIEVS